MKRSRVAKAARRTVARKHPRWRVADGWTSLIVIADEGEWSELDIFDTKEGREVTVSIPTPKSSVEAPYLEGDKIADDVCAFLNREMP